MPLLKFTRLSGPSDRGSPWTINVEDETSRTGQGAILVGESSWLGKMKPLQPECYVKSLKWALQLITVESCPEQYKDHWPRLA